MAGPGILYVTMQPEPGLPLQQFHEWYNNEHGPTRLKLPQIFTNGLRYQAADDQEPAYLAVYDVTAMSHLATEAYTSLRDARSPREAETIGRVDVQRYFGDAVLSKQSPLFTPVEQLTDEEAEGLTLVAVQLTPKEAANSAAEIQSWYGEEHMDMLSRVPGWLRSRLFKVSTLEEGHQSTKFIALHDYAKTNGLGGAEYQAAISTPRTRELYATYATMSSRRIYSLFYVFGAAARDLHNLSLLLPPAAPAFTSPDGRTSTTNGPSPVIESYATTPDGLALPYRLEGNPDPAAPTIALCNSLLTSLRMWDPVVALLGARRPRYRILRYDARGRHAIPAPVPATLGGLADDLGSLLAALRIPRLEALVGVSAGGATALAFALRHPAKVGRFVACDFNVASSAANTAAWKERIRVAEDGSAGMDRLAGQTVERWFHPDTMSRRDTVRWIRDMVAANDVDGFRHGCQALWDYDLRGRMRGCTVPGLFVVGEGDGKGALVKAMDGFRGLLGEGGAELVVVPGTGHLPMCENPEGFWGAVEGFV